MSLVCLTQHPSLRATFSRFNITASCCTPINFIKTRCTVIYRAIKNISYKCFLFKENKAKGHDTIECITINKRTSGLNILA